MGKAKRTWKERQLDYIIENWDRLGPDDQSSILATVDRLTAEKRRIEAMTPEEAQAHWHRRRTFSLVALIAVLTTLGLVFYLLGLGGGL